MARTETWDAIDLCPVEVVESDLVTDLLLLALLLTRPIAGLELGGVEVG